MIKIGTDLCVSQEKLMDFMKSLKNMELEVSTVIQKRKQLIDFDGYTREQQEIINSKINPEDYYYFKLFDKGVSIVLTNWIYDEELGKCKRAKEYFYSIKYYHCRSRLFKDKRNYLPYIYDNSSYGQFESLDVAISYFKKAVIDLLAQCGCIGLDPLCFV